MGSEMCIRDSHKHEDSVPGVMEKIFRADFRAVDSQVIISQFPSFSSDRLYPKP